MKHSFYPWVATLLFVAAVCLLTTGVPAQRETNTATLGRALTFHASFDSGPDADFGSGDRRIYTASSYKQQQEAQPGLNHPDVAIEPGRFGRALHFTKKNTKAVFYRAEKNVAFRETNWSGTVAFWLSLDPNSDLEPGYCDPIQLTDKDYNDAAVWVDFTKDERPRHFRLGVFGDLHVWNPRKIPPDQNPDFKQRLVTVTNPPFARGKWTHVAITFTNLNGAGSARLFLDGRRQGSASNISEPFTWELARAAIRLGVNYVGLYDDLLIFNRSLNDEEIAKLNTLPAGGKSLRGR